jgi:hypothetical protein
MKAKTRPDTSHLADLTDPRSVEPFRKAAKLFTMRATKTKAAARQTLVTEGIYTKAGRLTKHYV